MFGLKRKWMVGIVVSIGLVLVFAWTGKTSIRHDAGWRYATEIITGNWSPDQPPASQDGISDEYYLMGLLAAMVLNYGPYVVLLAAFKGFVEGKKVMNLIMAMAVRDEVAKSSLLELLAQSMPLERAEEMIDRAYETTDRTWEERLGRMIGAKGLSQVMEELRQHKFSEGGDI